MSNSSPKTASNSSPSESTANNPENRTYEKPVAWLAGRDLLGGIKGILLYTAYGSKLDPRDWMTGKVIAFDSGNEQEFWFDFLADAGDGTKAMYSIAYLTMTDLWANADNEPLSEDGKQQIAFETGEGRERLPRGRFLTFGGDTAYHVADYLTIANRIQRPFTWAYLDLRRRDQDIDVRPVFGIPGNHDYYDQLDGFRRQFRKSSREEPPQPPTKPAEGDAQLGLAGYQRQQQASYFALKLPFDWWLWALDTETGEIDPRQKKFFLTRGDESDDAKTQPPPDKLIILTPSPSTVFGKSADRENDFKATKAMIELFELSEQDQPFLPKVLADGSLDFSQTGDHQLKPGQCRLDIAGDVHHYARYWGQPPDKPIPTREHAAQKPVPQASSYASIVSGLGGAFHHPSNTYDDEIQEQVLYPSEKTSREAVGKELFDFKSISSGGYVWLFGAIIASLIYFAMSVTQSSRQDISNIGPLPWVHLNLVRQEPIMPTAKREEACAEVPPLIALGPPLLICDPDKTPVCPPSTRVCTPKQPFYFFITDPRWPGELWAGTILIFLSLAGTIVTFFLNTWLFGPKRDLRKPQDDKLPKPTPGRKLLRIVPPIAISVLIGMYTVGRYRGYITPFVSSLLVLFTMIVAAGGIVLTVRYNDYLFQKGHDEYIKTRDRFWPWVLPFLSVLVIGSGLSAFGRNNLPALLVSDILFALVFVGVLVALIALPFAAAGELFYTLRPRWLAPILKFLIGLWHAVLQLFVPFVLIRKGTYLTWLIVLILLVFPFRISAKLFKNNHGIWLAILWVVYGGFVLVLPWLTSEPYGKWIFNIPSHFGGADWLLAPWGLVPTVLAGVVGAVMSCLWFGWYLGVCSAFNGHNNEVGGAARIEKFKQFIRFKVTKDRLTGYVIAVDDVSLIGQQDKDGIYYDGRALNPKLIEVFHLEPKR
ncbi:MAG TPA: hypothetical protein VGC60_12130 [Pyrinomonadaceae bacterium]